jgi:hypothetical protein
MIQIDSKFIWLISQQVPPSKVFCTMHKLSILSNSLNMIMDQLLLTKLSMDKTNPLQLIFQRSKEKHQLQCLLVFKMI